MVAQDRQPYINTQQDAAFQFCGCPTVIRSTGETTDNHFFLMESLDMPVGLASPDHVRDEAGHSTWLRANLTSVINPKLVNQLLAQWARDTRRWDPVSTAPEQDILGTSVLATYIGGKAVYERPAGK